MTGSLPTPISVRIPSSEAVVPPPTSRIERFPAAESSRITSPVAVISTSRDLDSGGLARTSAATSPMVSAMLTSMTLVWVPSETAMLPDVIPLPPRRSASRVLKLRTESRSTDPRTDSEIAPNTSFPVALPANSMSTSQ